MTDKNFIEKFSKDKDVIVIGGGDTGNDCLGTSLRHGCKSLTNFESMPELPKDRLKITLGHCFLEFIKWITDTKNQEKFLEKILENTLFLENNLSEIKMENLLGIKTVKVDKDFKEIPGTEKTWKADLILLAMGFLGPEHYLDNNLDLELDERSNFRSRTQYS